MHEVVAHNDIGFTGSYFDLFYLKMFIRADNRDDLLCSPVIPFSMVSELDDTLVCSVSDIRQSLGIVESVTDSGWGPDTYSVRMPDGELVVVPFVYFDPNILAKLAWLEGHPVEVCTDHGWVELTGPALSGFPADSGEELCFKYRPKPVKEPSPPDSFSSYKEMVETLRDVFRRASNYFRSLPSEERDSLAFFACLSREGYPGDTCALIGLPSMLGASMFRFVSQAESKHQESLQKL